MRRFQVDFETSLALPPGIEDSVRTAIIKTLSLHSALEETNLTVLLTDEPEIRDLNRRFMSEDRSTDVLSFPTGDATPGSEGYIGDIAICVPVAQRQADIAGYPLEVELQLLAVHATLHLLGFDHANRQDKQEMWRRQASVLSALEIQFAEPP